MNSRRLKLSAALVSVFGLTGLRAQHTQKVTDLKGDYLGQPQPGGTPMVFARGIVSDQLRQQHGVPAFSPDGNEVFWQTNRLDSQKKWIISTMTARRVGDRWTAPGVSPYGSGPAFSPDGKRLYLDSKGEGEDAHFVEKHGNRWSEPKSVGIVRRFPEVRHVYCPSIALSGTLYFVGYLEGQAMNLGIYRAELVNGEYARPELLPPSINSRKGARNWTPYVAPDESFLLFCSTRGLPASDQGDLFVSFRRPDGSWSDGTSLGAPINSAEMERFPAVSPDGKHLFFTRDTPGFDEDVYWVSAGIIAS